MTFIIDAKQVSARVFPGGTIMMKSEAPGPKGNLGRFIKNITYPGLAFALVLTTACAADRGGLSEREIAAARDWKPTRWADGKGTALVVMDMQRANMPIFDQERVIGAIQRLVAAADAAGSPVVWVYSNDEDSRPGEDRFELAPPFAPALGHIKIIKVEIGRAHV